MTEMPARPLRHLAHRPWRAASYASLDFETTGLDVERDDIISFGVVPIRGGRAIPGEAMYREVSPTSKLTGRTIVVHGIRPMDLIGAPPIDQVADELRRALAGRYVIAWAAEIEAAFLAKVFGRTSSWWRRRMIDVLRLAILAERSAHFDPGDYSLTSVAKRLQVPVEHPHHALDDALTTAQVFLTLMPRLDQQRVGTPTRMVRASRVT
jgi:DNA polymerase-3 subunit epsilon